MAGQDVSQDSSKLSVGSDTPGRTGQDSPRRWEGANDINVFRERDGCRCSSCPVSTP